ncbi:hypothetical protein [Ruegeria sp. HKCCD6119]|uniref:hypothetical protein n=1 Tax=Ruegeria sp. HKCCD6119 TaxID=2683003 RepID=UPI001492E573|nr:hypothetical protein [Ruegeria sp. HKCCD6119]NOD83751.1 hypothetical protein [Ruegeria sp. HKCCD6119]
MNPYEGMSLEEASAAMDARGVTKGILMENGMTAGGEYIAGQETPQNVAASVRNDGGFRTVEVEPGNPASRTSVEAALAAGLITKEQLEANPKVEPEGKPEGSQGDDDLTDQLGPQDLDQLLGEENTDIVNTLLDSMGEEATSAILGQSIEDGNVIDVDAIREALGEGAPDEAVEDALNDIADVLEDGLDYLSEQVAAAGMDPDMVAQVVANDPELLAEGKAAFAQFLTDGSMTGIKAIIDKVYA